MLSPTDNVWDLPFKTTESRKKKYQIFWWLLEPNFFENSSSADGNVWNQ